MHQAHVPEEYIGPDVIAYPIGGHRGLWYNHGRRHPSEPGLLAPNWVARRTLQLSKESKVMEDRVVFHYPFMRTVVHPDAQTALARARVASEGHTVSQRGRDSMTQMG